MEASSSPCPLKYCTVPCKESQCFSACSTIASLFGALMLNVQATDLFYGSSKCEGADSSCGVQIALSLSMVISVVVMDTDAGIVFSMVLMTLFMVSGGYFIGEHCTALCCVLHCTVRTCMLALISLFQTCFIGLYGSIGCDSVLTGIIQSLCSLA